MAFMDSFFGNGSQGSGWAGLIGSILGGLSDDDAREDSERATKEATREAGDQNRLTEAFRSDMDYFREQQRRHETSRALDGSYNQFSTVRQWAPGFTPGPGLDAMPSKPDPENYKNADDFNEEDDDD